MNKKAIITISSQQNNVEDSRIEVVSPGEFYKEKEAYCAEYNETEISGMEGTRTTLKVSPEKFTLLRVGTTNAEMNFEKDGNALTIYNTPYGVIEMKIETLDLKVNIDEFGGDILVNYNLIIGGEKPQSTILKVNIKA
ncbi:DUF1934 domain-containing protein [Candidatus Clostridium stratigraminis]|uniref:DUF1934 domain-containing protein n=1 Tax=Candidatus Clostridium stratigraminis TaxID=3381661 RepID=A0ABW8T064_9CLOT